MTPTSGTTSASFEAAYEAFEKQQNGILLSAVLGSTPTGGLNATGSPATTSDGTLNYTTIPDLPLPGTIPGSTADTAPISAPTLESVTDIIAKSDADAAAALAAYAKGGGLSSLLDVSA